MKRAENCWRYEGKGGIAMLGKALLLAILTAAFLVDPLSCRSRRNPIDDEWGAERGRDASGQEGKRRSTG
jgi:hypothetical protein